MTGLIPAAPAAECLELQLVRGGRAALFVPALTIGRGQTWGVIGPNGAGKTSLLRALALLDRPASGTLRLFGAPPPAPAPLGLRRRVVLAFQETLLLDRTALANVALPLRLRGALPAAAGAAAHEALELFGAAHLAERRAQRLSGGESRRVALARAFAARPELLLLDEPFAALDPPSRELLATDLKRAIAATATTCVAVSHDRAEALALADHLGVVLAGRLVQAGPTEEVFGAPATAEIARFVGVENVLPARCLASNGDGLRVETGGFELLAASPSRQIEIGAVCVRAEDVTLAALAAGGPNELASRVAALESQASGLLVRLEPSGLRARLTRASAESLQLRVGSPVVARIPPQRIHLVPDR